MSLKTSADMMKTFKLPLLPGNTCGEELLRKNFRKTQLVSSGLEPRVRKEVPFDFDSTYVPNSTAGSTKATQEQSDLNATQNTLDQVVLRFFGYFLESVPESALETVRVRKVVICFFLEDGTMSITEPRTDNSGFSMAGTLLRRHRVPRPEGGFISYEHLAVGTDLVVYNRSYRLVDADAFTRHVYSNNGVDLAPKEETPTDAYFEKRKMQTTKAHDVPSVSSVINAHGMKVKLSQNEIRATKQFLQNDRKVLRVYAKWDDSSHLYGHARYFTLFYFLGDDTLEVTETLDNNSGYDPFPSFCRRSRIAKPRDAASASGNNFYTDQDLRIGAELVIFGRKFLIYDYDKFTQEHLASKYGVTEYHPIDVKDKAPPPVPRVPPPYNGYGDEEDSLGSWYSLDIKPPRRSHEKFDKFGYNVTKFLCKLDNGVATDDIRKFVLTAFLSDDSISIFEPVGRNSGIVGGKFLQRQKVRNEQTGEYFTAADFFVGGRVVVNKFPFLLVATDERSLNYMEGMGEVFPKSNINTVTAKLRAMLVSKQSGLIEALRRADREQPEVDYKKLSATIQGLGLDIVEQEVLTVLRYASQKIGDTASHEDLAKFVLDGAIASAASDPRPWTEIFNDGKTAKSNVHQEQSRADEAQQRRDNAAAALGAQQFLDAYNARRQLFHAELRFICDHSADSKIGVNEFCKCIREKLPIRIPEDQLTALCAKLFPPAARRVELMELLRLMNGTSNYNHNVASIKSA